MRILKRGNNNTKRLAYTALLRSILEDGAVCWDPYREGQASALYRVQRRAAKLANNRNESGWETLAQRRMIARICAFFKKCTEGRACKAITMLSRDDNNWKIRPRKQRTDVGKYAVVNRTIKC